MSQGPDVGVLLQRLVATPADFLVEIPIKVEWGSLSVLAVVADTLRLWSQASLSPELANNWRYQSKQDVTQYRNHMRLCLLACWLLHEESFADLPENTSKKVQQWMSKDLKLLAELVKADHVVRDSDRREEFVRSALRALDLRPAGESRALASDRLQTLDSVARARVIQETKAAQDRVRKIRAEMQKKRAAEAAAAWGRE